MIRRNVPLTKLQRRVLKSILTSHGKAAPVRRKRKARMTASRRRVLLANLRKARAARWSRKSRR